MAFLLYCVLYAFDSWREANVIYARVITSRVIYVRPHSSNNSITYNTPRPESALRRLYIACSNQSNHIVFAFILLLSVLSSLGYVTSVMELESSYDVSVKRLLFIVCTSGKTMDYLPLPISLVNGNTERSHLPRARTLQNAFQTSHHRHAAYLAIFDLRSVASLFPWGS